MSNVKITIEGAPDEALVAGPDHIGLRYPDRELSSVSIGTLDLIDRQINVNVLNFITPDGITTAFADVVEGDLFQYTASSGVTDTIPYLPDANYFDISDIQSSYHRVTITSSTAATSIRE